MADKLEELSKQFRTNNLKGNAYQNTDGKQYGATHPNATSDGDNKGKGTGVFLDTYNGGNDVDVKGNPAQPGSGRNAAMTMNKAKWGYGPDSPYKHPDTDDNEGQFRVK